MGKCVIAELIIDYELSFLLVPDRTTLKLKE